MGTEELGTVGGGRGARQKFALVKVRTKNKGERKRKRSLSIKAIGQIATSPNTQVIRKQIQFYLVLSTEFIQYNIIGPLISIIFS